jgi:hypothetical protein
MLSGPCHLNICRDLTAVHVVGNFTAKVRYLSSKNHLFLKRAFLSQFKICFPLIWGIIAYYSAQFIWYNRDARMIWGRVTLYRAAHITWVSALAWVDQIPKRCWNTCSLYLRTKVEQQWPPSLMGLCSSYLQGKSWLAVCCFYKTRIPPVGSWRNSRFIRTKPAKVLQPSFDFSYIIQGGRAAKW